MVHRLFLILSFLLVLIPSVVARAYEVTVENITIPYDVVALPGSPEQKRIILGDLSNAPEMYEITSDADFTLTVEIRAVPGESTVPQFSGIIVRQKEQLGVEEVARMKAVDATWARVVDGPSGLAYQAGPFFSEDVKAGTYHVEVSTPENSGKYILIIGNREEPTGYFKTLQAIGVVYSFYGLGALSMFHSPYIHYPLGIVVLVLLLFGTWYWNRRRTLTYHA